MLIRTEMNESAVNKERAWIGGVPVPARLDAPEALHPLMDRGIGRPGNFYGGEDKRMFSHIGKLGGPRRT